MTQNFTLYAGIYLFLELCGIIAAIHAVMNSRTSQGAIAWAVSLITLPHIILLVYLIFGRKRFSGYSEVMREVQQGHRDQIQEAYREIITGNTALSSLDDPILRGFSALADLPLLQGNDAQILKNGNKTFDAICAELKIARSYILFQFFIFHSDELGHKIADLLIERARSGVKVRCLFDQFGTFSCQKSLIEKLRQGGVEVAFFSAAPLGHGSRFQLNFRNHRKIVVVDGLVAFVGGHNVGDEYLGLSKKFGFWRDTHLRCVGPAVQALQVTFAKDWYWATKELLPLVWKPTPASTNDLHMFTFSTGPSDERDRCALFFLHAINSAKKRFWIASPYFVPTATLIEALQLAAMRGVDVRVILPKKADHILVYFAAFSYLMLTEQANVSVYRYHQGFMHQKVFVVDDDYAAIGTANFDNRSFRLNFEVMTLTVNKTFTAQVAQMLEDDLTQCDKVDPKDYQKRQWYYKFGVRVCDLLSPIL